MAVIIIGQFKDTHQTHFINKNNTDDSLRRTRVERYATQFKTRELASAFLDKMKINNKRFDECIYSFKDIR